MANTGHSNQPSSDAEVPQAEVAPVEAAAAPAERKRGAAAPQTSRGAKLPDHSDGPNTTKAEVVLKKLRSAKGATIEALMESTGWQAHSMRGFLSVTVKKKLGLTIDSEIGKDGVRRYRIADQKQAG